MSSVAFRAKIKTCLQTITRSIKQIPQDKQSLIASRVNKVLQKYANQETAQSLEKFSKELEFNLNFIKLSYPNINFNLQNQVKPQIKQQLNPKDQLINKGNADSAKRFQEQFQLENSEALKKQMKDISGVREEVQFSNWSQGNLDPQNLKRHKELLTRQHFGGQFWKQKEKPKMQTAEIISSFLNNPNIEPPKMTDKNFQKKEKTFVTDPSEAFQKVKR